MERTIKAKDSEAARLFHWVSLAAEIKDPARYFLNVVNVTEEGDRVRLVATDGRRLHTATIGKEQAKEIGVSPTPQIYAGAEILKRGRRQVTIGDGVMGHFPNWERVTPHGKGTKQVMLNDFIDACDLISFVNANVMPLRTNHQYLSEGMQEGQVLHLWDSDKSFRIDGDNSSAVIMPMKLWDNPDDLIKG